MTRTLAALRALAALLLLAALTVGTPVALLHLGVLPHQWATWSRTSHAQTGPDDGQLFLGALTIVGWLAWIMFTVSAAVETVAAVRGRSAPRVPVLGATQRLAATLVGSIVLLLPATTALAATAAPAQAANLHLPHATTGPEQVKPTQKAASPAVSGPTVTVDEPDQTLWSLAEQYLGSGMRWKEIVTANEGVVQSDGTTLTSSTVHLVPGWKLRLPADAHPGPDAQAAAHHTSVPTPGRSRPGPNPQPQSARTGAVPQCRYPGPRPRAHARGASGRHPLPNRRERPGQCGGLSTDRRRKRRHSPAGRAAPDRPRPDLPGLDFDDPPGHQHRTRDHRRRRQRGRPHQHGDHSPTSQLPYSDGTDSARTQHHRTSDSSTKYRRRTHRRGTYNDRASSTSWRSSTDQRPKPRPTATAPCAPWPLACPRALNSPPSTVPGSPRPGLPYAPAGKRCRRSPRPQTAGGSWTRPTHSWTTTRSTSRRPPTPCSPPWAPSPRAVRCWPTCAPPAPCCWTVPLSRSAKSPAPSPWKRRPAPGARTCRSCAAGSSTPTCPLSRTPAASNTSPSSATPPRTSPNSC